jgi:glycosyltransferase involved in cell wall biosynthesis
MATKQHCFFIGTGWWGDGAAVPAHFRALAEALAGRGHRVVLLVDGQRQAAADHAGNPAIYTWPSPRPTQLRDARFLYHLIRRYDPHCLIANFGAVNLMMLLGWLTGRPCRVAWYHTLSTQIDRDSHLPPWQMKLLRLRKRLFYQAATHIAANSEAAARDVQQVFGVEAAKCRVIYNALVDPMPAHIAKETNKIICVGRLYPSKGQDVLLRAAALLKEVLPGLSLEFAGGGPAEGEYQALAQALGIAGRCVWRGNLPHAQVLQRMAAAAVTVVPSRNEAFGLVNIESLAVGTPVVASAVGGITELVRDGLDGFLMPPDEPEALAEKLKQLLLDAGLRERMGHNARERFLACFEQTGAIAQQVAWLEEIVGRGTQGE